MTQYKPILQPSDFLAIQEDVSKVEEWSTTSSLSLNPIKCKYMIISRKAAPLQPESALILNGHILNQVDVYKYLGILLSKDLSWSPHVDGICSKACKILSCSTEGSTRSQTRTLFASYTLLLSDLIWSMPVLFGHPTPPEISMLLKVQQKFACKLASRRWNGNTYKELLTITNLPTLEGKSLELKLCHLFRFNPVIK